MATGDVVQHLVRLLRHAPEAKTRGQAARTLLGVSEANGRHREAVRESGVLELLQEDGVRASAVDAAPNVYDDEISLDFQGEGPGMATIPPEDKDKQRFLAELDKERQLRANEQFAELVGVPAEEGRLPQVSRPHEGTDEELLPGEEPFHQNFEEVIGGRSGVKSQPCIAPEEVLQVLELVAFDTAAALIHASDALCSSGTLSVGAATRSTSSSTFECSLALPRSYCRQWKTSGRRPVGSSPTSPPAPFRTSSKSSRYRASWVPFSRCWPRTKKVSKTRRLGRSGAIGNALTWGSAEQVQILVDAGCVGPLCDFLTGPDDEDAVASVIDGMRRILYLGEIQGRATNVGECSSGGGGSASGNNNNLLAAMIVEAGGMSKIQELQNHGNNDVREVSSAFVDEYFGSKG